MPYAGHKGTALHPARTAAFSSGASQARLVDDATRSESASAVGTWFVRGWRFFPARRTAALAESEWMSQQAVELILVKLVALACTPFEAGAIQYRHPSATVFDQLPSLQGSRDTGHAGAPNAEHHCQKFLREQKPI